MLHRIGFALILLPTLAAADDLTCTIALDALRTDYTRLSIDYDALKKSNETLWTVAEAARQKQNTVDGDLARQRLLFSQAKDCVATAASLEAARWCFSQ